MLDTTRDPAIRPTQPGEVPFGIDEIFYSRTDPRGVIIAANSVFQRIAGYSWDRLLGAPHRIVRHPEMPRGLFRLFWDYLAAGRPIGAYVINRAADGRHYWVFAVALPVEGGFLSVRIKPSGPQFPTIIAEYAELLRREAKERLTPEASAAILEDRVRALGHDSYLAFMADAIADEVSRRAEAVGRKPDAEVARVRASCRIISDIVAEMDALAADFARIRSIPTNLRIAASRMAAAAAPLSALSENYRIMSGDIIRRLERRNGADADAGDGMASTGRMRNEAVSALFLLCVSRLQDDTRVQCQTERDAGLDIPIDGAAELAFLSHHAEASMRDARQALMRLADNAAQLSTHCDEVRRMVVGLHSIRFLCRVEHGRLNGAGEGLGGIIDQFDHAHGELDRRIHRLAQLALDLKAAARL
jgi:aerotaxis receptor